MTKGLGPSSGTAQIWGVGQGRAETGPMPGEPHKIPRMWKGASSPPHNELFLLRICSASQRKKRERNYLWLLDATLNE